MGELYFYKVRHDDGGAPCVADKLLSLAICKPRTRSTASVGDWVFGFGSKAGGESLIYIAEVTTKFERGDYYRLLEGSVRADVIYEWDGPYLRWRSGALFHPDGAWAHKDVGEFPAYDRANVLLSSNFRYFGSAAKTDWKVKHPALRARVEALTQGERVKHTDVVRVELLALRDSMWAQHPAASVLGTPSNDRCDPCGPCDPDPDDDCG